MWACSFSKGGIWKQAESVRFTAHTLRYWKRFKNILYLYIYTTFRGLCSQNIELKSIAKPRFRKPFLDSLIPSFYFEILENCNEKQTPLPLRLQHLIFRMFCLRPSKKDDSLYLAKYPGTTRSWNPLGDFDWISNNWTMSPKNRQYFYHPLIPWANKTLLCQVRPKPCKGSICIVSTHPFERKIYGPWMHNWRSKSNRAARQNWQLGGERVWVISDFILTTPCRGQGKWSGFQSKANWLHMYWICVMGHLVWRCHQSLRKRFSWKSSTTLCFYFYFKKRTS